MSEIRIFELSFQTEHDTEQFAQYLSNYIQPGFVLYISGNLGTGKTTLIRTLLRSLGVVGAIKSPSYTLVEPYRNSHLTFYHFDLYRMSDSREWLEAGFNEYFDQHAIVLIEWPEHAAAVLPKPDLYLTLTIPESEITEQRILTIQAYSVLGQLCLDQLKPRLL